MSDNIGRWFPDVLARSAVRGADECWPWRGGLCTKGYGQIYRGRSILVHRIAYTATRGPIPPGVVIDHICHDPAVCPGGNCGHRLCVNPAHLAAVTNAENLRRQAPAFKTHCAGGHPLSGAHLGTTAQGRRYCRTCSRTQSSAWRFKRFTVRPSTVRAWAVERGLALPGGGALSKAAIAAWDAAHPRQTFRVTFDPLVDEPIPLFPTPEFARTERQAS